LFLKLFIKKKIATPNSSSNFRTDL